MKCVLKESLLFIMFLKIHLQKHQSSFKTISRQGLDPGRKCEGNFQLGTKMFEDLFALVINEPSLDEFEMFSFDMYQS